MKQLAYFSFFILLLTVSSFTLQAKEEIKWESLQSLNSNPQDDKSPEVSDELKTLLKNDVILKGFMLPMDYSAREITEFLLMPYIPACMHVPPPPPNQIIHVTMKEGKKIKPSFHPVEVSGSLTIEENPDFESSYKMSATDYKEID